MPNFHEALAEYCNSLLKEYPAAKVYKDYIKTRLSDKTIDEYSIGYFPSNYEISILLDKFDENVLIENKILFKSKWDNGSSISVRDKYSLFFSDHRLIIPFRDTYGKIIAFAGRTIISEDERQNIGISKYKNEIFNKSDYLFNLDKAWKNIKNENKVFLVEGQFDCISCVEKNIHNVVSINSSSLSAKQFALILRYTDNIYLLLDNDDSGNKGRELIANKYGKYANIHNVFLPKPYKDVDEFFKTNSYNDFRMFVDIS
jgi:DNA primase